MLASQLDMTGYSANDLLGERLFSALKVKGDVSEAWDCFCQRTAVGRFRGLTGTQRLVHWYAGAARLVLLC